VAISFQCSCGKKLKADDGNAGQTVRCPNCANLLNVPTKDLGYEVVEDNEEKDEEGSSPEPEKDEEFDVLEDDRDLPNVERVKKRRKKKDLSRAAQRNRTIQDDLHDTGYSFMGWDWRNWYMVGSIVLSVLVCMGCGCVSGISRIYPLAIFGPGLALVILILIPVVLRVAR
jgi:hypothetical protein